MSLQVLRKEIFCNYIFIYAACARQRVYVIYLTYVFVWKLLLWLVWLSPSPYISKEVRNLLLNASIAKKDYYGKRRCHIKHIKAPRTPHNFANTLEYISFTLIFALLICNGLEYRTLRNFFFNEILLETKKCNFFNVIQCI